MNQITPRTTAHLDRLLSELQTDRRLPSLAAGIVRDGRPVWTGFAGTLTGRADGQLPTGQTQYRIGSITKTFVAVLVMRLRDAGRLELTDRLDEHLRDTHVGQVTLEQLLSHAARVQAETDGPWWERTPGIDFAALADQTRIRPKSLGHHYSNVGFALLGQVIQARHDRPWLEVLSEEVLHPLGLCNTTALPNDGAAPGWAVHPFADVLMPEPAHDAGAMAPAGQLWSTVEDLLTWADFLARGNEQILASSTLEEMLQPRAVVDVPDQPWTQAWGLGWQLRNLGGRRVPGHGGSMPGFQAGLLADRSSRTGAVAFANSTDGSPGTLEFLEAFGADEPAPATPWHAAGDPAQLELLGTWHWGPAAVTFTAAGGVLRMEGGRSSRFSPIGHDEFIGLDGYYAGETLRVVRDGTGSVSHLDLASFRFSRTAYAPGADIPGGLVGRWT